MLILYNPKSNATGKPVLPMALLALGAKLEGRFDYRIVDGNLEALDARDATIVAMTVMPGQQLADAVAEARKLKQRQPQTTIVWGGYFPTQHADACLDSPLIDYVLRGHADEHFGLFVESLLSGNERAVRSTPGLSYRGKNGELRQNPEAEMPSPDALPDFPYHRVRMESYVRSTFMGTRTLPHHSSYGCPFTCNFCAVVNLAAGRWRAQTAERTARVTRSLVRDYNVNAIEFYDNNFFVDEDRIRKYASLIADLRIGWWGEARIDTLLHYSHSTWNLMRESGLRMVFLGAESGSDETLELMNKGGTATVEKTIEIARKMRDHSIIPEFSFIVGNPPEPRKDAERTMAFIRRLKRVNPACEIVLYLYTPVPLVGNLFDEAMAQGFSFPRTLDEWTAPQWTAFSARRSLTVPWLERSLRQRIWDFERVLNAYYPTTTDTKLQRPVRLLLRSVSAWRYHLGIYRFPLELRALHKLIAYQRPETSGF